MTFILFPYEFSSSEIDGIITSLLILEAKSFSIKYTKQSLSNSSLILLRTLLLTCFIDENDLSRLAVATERVNVNFNNK